MFGVYIHWPYCASKCPYCDFNSHVAQAVDHEVWRARFKAEIRHYAVLTPGRTVTSVFFGGGTPSLMQPETVAAVLDEIAKGWTVAGDMEVTLEANPTSVEAEKFKAFRQAGVNRVSLGVQSLNDSDLQFLGRRHTAAEARAAVDVARAVFERYSFDLMYARPGQSVEGWRAELRDALALAGGHLSLYQLTIEKGTPFYAMDRRGDFIMPDNDIAGAFYELTQEVMEAHGLPAYEVSNHAALGQESVHNLTYWRYGDYVGVGPGAHGRLSIEGRKYATRGHRAPEIWLERVRADGHGAHPFEEIDAQQQRQEKLMMGMRLREGVFLDDLLEGDNRNKVAALQDEGLVLFDGATLRPTSAGLQRLNGILRYLL